MNVKKIIITISVILASIILLSLIIINRIENNNIKFIENEFSQNINEKISQTYISQIEKINEYKISDIEFAINDVKKEKKNCATSQYTISISVKCKADKTLSKIEKELVSYFLKDIFNDYSNNSLSAYKLSNGLNVSIRSCIDHEKQITTYINDEIVSYPGMEDNSTKPSVYYYTSDYMPDTRCYNDRPWNVCKHYIMHSGRKTEKCVCKENPTIGKCYKDGSGVCEMK